MMEEKEGGRSWGESGDEGVSVVVVVTDDATVGVEL